MGQADGPPSPEGPLRVDVHGLALTPTLVHRHLGGHTERVAELGLAGPELAEDLGQGARLDPAWWGVGEVRAKGWEKSLSLSRGLTLK